MRIKGLNDANNNLTLKTPIDSGISKVYNVIMGSMEMVKENCACPKCGAPVVKAGVTYGKLDNGELGEIQRYKCTSQPPCTQNKAGGLITTKPVTLKPLTAPPDEVKELTYERTE